MQPALEWDVVVLGAGACGVAAATAAAQSGARTLLVDAGPMPGGELISGIAMLGAIDTRGRWIVAGVARQLLDEVRELGGYIGPVFDYRSLHLVCFDVEWMKLAVGRLLERAGVELLLYSFMHAVERDAEGRVLALRVFNKAGEQRLRARVFVDASGDADLVHAAGGETELGDGAGRMQPPSLVFRMVGVDGARLLDMVVDEPGHFGLAEFPGLGLSREDCARRLRLQGQPKAVLLGDRGLLRAAIASGEMFATSIVAIVPVSTPRREISINCTQLADVDATRPAALSQALPRLMAQVEQSVAFLRRRVRGFEGAAFSNLAPRIGVRETRRFVGDVVLDEGDVLEARLPADTVALGGHEIDLFAVTSHRRQTIRDGAAYGIPYGCLLPRGLTNVLAGGRCLSSTRAAQSSARVMGTCMAMGHAAGTAAALAARRFGGEVRSVPVGVLREQLLAQGALLAEAEA